MCRPSTGSRARGAVRVRSGEKAAEVERALVARVGQRLGVDGGALARLSVDQRAVVLGELREVERAFRANPLLGYRPHVPQRHFHGAIGLDLRAFFGGNRSGKTTASIVDSLVQTVDVDLLPDHLLGFKRFHPPFYCRVVTPDLSNTLEGVVLQKIREWCPPGQLRGGNFEKAYDKVLRVLHFRNGSWWQFNSNDQELNKLGGTALHRVVYDEEPRRDIRRECLMRLLDYGGDEVFAMTPLIGLSTFTFDEIYEPWEQGRAPEGSVTVADMEDNPHLPAGEIERVLAGCSAEERMARKSGRFVAFEGLIYKEFDDGTPAVPGRHVVPAFRSLPAGEVFVGIDPGIRHMCAVVWCHISPEDRLTVFDELADGGQTIGAVCRRIHERNARWGVTPRWYVIDPASRNKNHQTGRSDAQEFADHGVVCIPGQNSVTAGINRVKERLQREPAALVVSAGCRETRKEFTRYRWSKPKRGEADARESPVKAADHLLDALRYVVMSRPLAPAHGGRGENLTLKDRLVRDMLSKQGLGRPVGHASGPGIFQ